MCAIVFLTFSFVWLYCFQADVLAAAQHVLSKGLTSYKPLVGALLITLVLQAGLNTSDLKLFSAIVVAVALAIPALKKGKVKGGDR